MDRTKTFHFLGGLPRSGSTVLASILNQNPEVYVTPTSPLLDLLVKNQHAWYENPSVRANPFPDQLTNMTQAMIQAAWSHRPEPVIIDKGRGWGKNMPASTILFRQEIKMIATVRDLPSIMASWLTIMRKNPGSRADQMIVEKGHPVNDTTRCNEMWFGMVRDCMETLVQAKKDAANRILFVKYDDLMALPNPTMKKIEDFLGLPSHQYQFENIENDTQDDDLLAWGLDGLHRIRPKLQNTSKPAIDVLGPELFERFKRMEKQYDYL